MAAQNLEKSLELVFGHEGGFTDNPKDKGNWTGGQVGKGLLKGTKFGISAAAYPTLDINSLTLAKAAGLYRKDYWGAVRGDELPSGVDHCIFDFAVNSGPFRAIIGLQRALGVADDGKIGPITLAAIRKKDPQILIQAVCTGRMTFLRQLSDWREFGAGWTKRVKKVEREALAMTARAVPSPPDIEPIDAPKPSWIARFIAAVVGAFRARQA